MKRISITCKQMGQIGFAESTREQANSSIELKFSRDYDVDLTPLDVLEPGELKKLDLTGFAASANTVAAITEEHTGLTELRFKNTRKYFPDGSLDDLGNCVLDHHSCANLSALQDLRRLDLPGTFVNDGFLTHLCELKMLEYLNLAETDLSYFLVHGFIDGYYTYDDARLKNLSKLRYLNLSRSMASYGAVYNCGLYLDALEVLDLSHSRVVTSDFVFPPGSKVYPSLKHLVLGGQLIADEGINYLLELPNLRSLELRSTKISENGIKKLSEKFDVKQAR